MPAFCRHNRFLANCPICSREQAASAPKPAPRTRSAGGGTRSSSSGPARSRTHMRTRQLARETEDGYRSDLIPGVKATADAERLARALAAGAARLEYPGPVEEVAAEPDPEQATWLAFLVALAGPEAPELRAAVLAARPPWEAGEAGVEGLDAARARTAAAYRAWVGRSGSQAAAFGGEAGWTPARRFSRVFERLAFPGFGRAARFELLTTLGAAGVHELEAASLHLGGEDPTTVAAKRALQSGDVVLLERRAAALAGAAGVPLAALDHGLASWNAPRRPAAPAAGEVDPPALPAVRAALGLR